MIRPLLLFALLVSPALAQEPRLRLPVACAIGQTCFVQNHVDLDPSPGARDFSCGTLTYEGHNGTDFRVPTLAVQREGVNVLAAADGRVLRGRDGVRDVSVAETGRAGVEGGECGNGLVVAHEGGLETQYCHMAQGSLAVRPGDTVKAGQLIGKIGLSGLTEYPHLHFTVRRNGTVVDPFAPDHRPGACASETSLWDDATRQALAYRPSAILNAGFASGPVTMEAIEAGDAARAVPNASAPALVAFVRAIGLKGGDAQVLTLTGPDGRVLAESRPEALDRDKAQWMMFSGIRRPSGGWPAGTYRARYTVQRAGKPALEHAFTLDLKP